MDIITFSLILLAWVPSVLFPLYYGVTASWWDTLMGRGLFTYATCFGLFMTLSFATEWLGPDFAGRGPLRVLAYALFMVGLWAISTTYIVTYHRARRARSNRKIGSS